MHAYAEALRARLAGAGVEMTELIPPAVSTTPEFDFFVDETMSLLAIEPTPPEILVEAARMHRWAERDGTYAGLVARSSAALRTLPGR